MRRQKHWYLGLLAFIGVYKLPLVIATFSGTAPWWDALNLLWFLWLLNFVPQKKVENTDG